MVVVFTEEATMTLDRQTRANRENGRQGGVKTEAGKAISRLNARRHGVFTSALTRLDREELAGIYEDFASWLQPAGPIEEALVEKLALTWLRVQRCARAEGEYHVRAWEERRSEEDLEMLRRQGEPPSKLSPFRPRVFEEIVRLFGRYSTTLTNQFIKVLHEIERLQRLRAGERVPAPLAADVTVGGSGLTEAAEDAPPGRQTH